MTPAVIETEEQATPRPCKKRWLLLIAIATIFLFILVGLVVQKFSGSHGLSVVSEAANALAQKMRIVRPLVFFIVFCFWQPLLGLASRIRILTGAQTVRLVQNRNGFFLWVALFEITVGQGQVVLGVVILVSILVYPWLADSLRRGPRT